MLVPKAGKNRSILDFHRLEFVCVESKCSQDRRSDLRSHHGGLQYRTRKTRVRNDKAHIGIATAESAVFSVLLARTGVDRPVDGLNDDVRRPAVMGGVVELQL